MKDHEILNAVAAGESLDWEFKSAKGGFPLSVWETYSAMANTDGGTIVLGIGEANDAFFVEGLKSPQQALEDVLGYGEQPRQGQRQSACPRTKSRPL